MATLTPAALSALSVLLDVNDDDAALTEAGIDPAGMADLRAAVQRSARVATMPRSLRIPNDVWHASVAKAKVEGTTVTAVVVAALRRYLKR